MTNRRFRPALQAILLALGIIAQSCAGTQARENVLLPALRNAWVGIRVQAVRQSALEDDPLAEQIIARADAALKSGSPTLVAAVDWPRIDALALDDISTRVVEGAIWQGVAESLTQRVQQFQAARVAYIKQVNR